jgi:hypothetical protein
MVEYSTIGFDLRKRGEDFALSADCAAWPQAVLAYQAAIAAGFAENAYQLIDVGSTEELAKLVEVALSVAEGAVIVELSIPRLVADARTLKDEGGATSIFVEPYLVASEGYDVCDINGLFSAFEMGKDLFQRSCESSADLMLEACVVAQAASLLIPSHSPFVVVRVRVVKL